MSLYELVRSSGVCEITECSLNPDRFYGEMFAMFEDSISWVFKAMKNIWLTTHDETLLQYVNELPNMTVSRTEFIV